MNINEVIKTILAVIGALGGTASKINRQDSLSSLLYGKEIDCKQCSAIIPLSHRQQHLFEPVSQH